MGLLRTLGHVHLSGTDFHSKVELPELVKAARANGFTRIDLTPHLRDPMYPYQEPPIPFHLLRLILLMVKPIFLEELGLYLRVGAEVDILPNLDSRTAARISEVWLRSADVALVIRGEVFIASYHFTKVLGWEKERDEDICPQQDPGWMLDGYLQLSRDAMPKGSIFGHIFKYSSDLPSQTEVRQLAQVAKTGGIVLEISLQSLLRERITSRETLWRRIPLLDPSYVEVFSQIGVGLYLGTDIHNPNQLDCLCNIQLAAEHLLLCGVQEQQLVGWEE